MKISDLESGSSSKSLESCLELSFRLTLRDDVAPSSSSSRESSERSLLSCTCADVAWRLFRFLPPNNELPLRTSTEFDRRGLPSGFALASMLSFLTAQSADRAVNSLGEAGRSLPVLGVAGEERSRFTRRNSLVTGRSRWMSPHATSGLRAESVLF